MRARTAIWGAMLMSAVAAGPARAFFPATTIGGGAGPVSGPIVIDPTPPPPPPPPPPSPDPLILGATGTTWIRIVTHAPAVGQIVGTSELYRQHEGGAWIWQRSVPQATRVEILDTGLEVGDRYCYRLDTPGAGSDFLCASTEWRVGFEAPRMETAESESVLALFDWRDTEPLPEGPPEEPEIYYMNLLVEHPDAPDAFRRFGVHVQGTPVFPVEREGWNPTETIVRAPDGGVAGRWMFAVVPGRIYNDLRDSMLAMIAAGEAPGIRALVFRQIPDWDARRHPLDRHSLSYRHLGERGFHYDVHEDCVPDAELGLVCTEEILGWFARKVAGWIEDGVEVVVDNVRGAFGRITRLVHGEVTLGIQLRLLNTDPAFGDSPMISGWSGEELRLSDVRVFAEQGLALFWGRSDSQGFVELEVARGQGTRICIETENAHVELTEFLTEERVCIEDIGEISGNTTRTVEVQHPYFNTLASMTDARDYMSTVVGYQVPHVTVLVGNMADNLAVAGRSFAPCMGRVPNLALGGGADLLGALGTLLAGPSALILSSAPEFFYSVDIVLRTGNDQTRGVPVHEYGHAVMCGLLSRQGWNDFQTAYTDVILATADQSAENEPTYLNEAFADFIASQVLGATNYFPTTGSRLVGSMDYCDAGSTCLEENFDEADDRSRTSLGTISAFSAQVRRVVSLLHDAFDGSASAARPNDGSHWRTSTSPMPHVPGNDSDADDESVILPGAALRTVFERWDERGNLLRESSFLGGLADAMLEAGHDENEVCALFALHEASGSCPSYVPGSSSPRITVPSAPLLGSSGTVLASAGEPCPDQDGDGLCDAVDRCPFYVTASNADVDGNGIGDACECGDQNGDGSVDVRDILAIGEAIRDPPQATDLCDANGDGACNVGDILAVNARIFGMPTSCARYPRP